MQELFYTFKGIVRIGYNMVFCVGGFWPLAKMDFCESEIVIRVFGFKKKIPYSKIKRLSWTTPVTYGGYSGYVRIEHENGGFPYVAFRIWTGPNSPTLFKICHLLKSKGVMWDGFEVSPVK